MFHPRTLGSRLTGAIVAKREVDCRTNALVHLLLQPAVPPLMVAADEVLVPNLKGRRPRRLTNEERKSLTRGQRTRSRGGDTDRRVAEA